MKKLLVMGSLFILMFVLTACQGSLATREKPLVVTTLFPQYDIANTLAGDLADVRLILPPGVDAHTFEPTPRMISEIINADLLIQTSDRMEPWVNRLVQPSSQNLSVLMLSQHVNRIQGNPEDYHNGETITTFELLDLENRSQMTAWFHVDHWHGSLPTIPLGSSIDIGAFVANARGQEVPLALDGFRLEARIADFLPRDVVNIEIRGDVVVLEGLKDGLTQLIFTVYEDNAVIFETPALNVRVQEGFERVISPQAPAPSTPEQGGDYDPHIWTDPLNVMLMVQVIEERLIDLLPEHEATLRDRAEIYMSELERLHESFLHMRQHIEVTTLMYGGHNAMGYFIARYNLEYVNAYRGFSSDAEPVPTAISNMISIMNTYQIEHLFSEKMLNQNVAQTIQQATGATILYLYAMENITPEELATGVTLLDMFEHNLTQLKIGLRYQNETLD